MREFAAMIAASIGMGLILSGVFALPGVLFLVLAAALAAAGPEPAEAD